MKKFINYIAPCIEVVGYRQKKQGIKSFGDLCSDFGANIKFIIGPRKKYKNNDVKNLKTNISNSKIKQSVNGNTNTVYINPISSKYTKKLSNADKFRKLCESKIKKPIAGF